LVEQARLGKPFAHDAYLSELTGLRDQLKAGLSGTAHRPDNKEGPSVSELAERIKALKAAHTIEATPQRVQQKHSTAEEPVTARIRRRTEAIPASDPAIQADAPASQPGTPALPQSTANFNSEHLTPSANSADRQGITQDSSITPEMTFRERIAIERQRKEPGLS
jgi:hypothetical protein